MSTVRRFKWLALAFVMLFGGVVVVSAAPVDFETAQSVARKHLERTRGGKIKPAQRSLAKAAAPSAPYYVLEKESGGFVIVSGDDIAVPILGEVDNGGFDRENMPPALLWLLGTYEKQIEEAVKDGAAQDQETKGLWAQTTQMANAAAAADYSLTLLSTTWNQGEPYNLQCPLDGTQRSVTGCLATAMAQIMKYWQHPAIGRGASEAYYTVKKNIYVPSVRFNMYYDYANMLDTYTANGGTTVQRDAISTLMYHCGVSIKMDYSYTESYAFYSGVATALTQYFDYDNSIKFIFTSKNNRISASEWKDLVIGQIENNSPIYYGGQDVGGTGGHAFIIDGYNDVTDRFHLNWGWGGNYDGFFALTALNPSTYQYNSEPNMTINIMPNKYGNAPSQIKVSSFNVSRTRITVNADIMAKMYYGAEFSGKIGLAVMSGSAVSMVLDSADYSVPYYNYSYTVSDSGYYNTITSVNYTDAKLGKQFSAGMPSGNLTLQLVTKRGSGTWAPVGGTRQIFVPSIVTVPRVTAGLVYTGQEQSAGIAANDIYTVTGDVAIDAGDYEATVALKDKNNFMWEDGTTDDLTLAWSIAKAAGTGTVTITGWTYGESANAPATEDGTGIAVFTYKFQGASDGWYSENVPVNAGNYTIRATFVESKNHSTHTDTADFVITKKSIAIPIAVTDLVYTGASQAGVPVGDGYKVTSDGSAVNAGLYIATVIPDGNHVWDASDNRTVARDVVWSIAKANPTYVVPAGLTATYGDALADVTLPTGWSWEETGTVGNIGAQTHTATFTPADTTNYNVVAGVDVTVTVYKTEFAIGPNPAGKSSGAIAFFRQGKQIKSGTLTVYDASGNVVRKLAVNDNAGTGNARRRAVVLWDLKDSKGRQVSKGTYLVKGKIVTSGGQGERVSVVVGVR